MMSDVVHLLVDNCVTNEGGGRGITAKCTCGWVSGGHFSSMSASAMFQDHKEHEERVERDAG